MKKKNLIALICIIAVGILGFFISSRFLTKTDAHMPDFTIALFVPAIHPAMDEIMRGFKDALAQDSHKKYHFREYNANNNPTLLRSQADEIISQHYDLIFTVGVTCAHTVFELLRKKNEDTPLIFTAVDDPKAMGIIDSLESSGNNVTGVISTPLYEQQIAALLEIRPQTKNIMLVYNPTQGRGFEEQKNMFSHLLQKKNIKLHPLEIASPNEIMHKVGPLLEGMDVVLILTDHTAVMGVPSLATLCARYGVTLYASDLNSADKGAALAFGVTEYDYGKLAAPLALTILENKKNPALVPIVPIKKQYIKINTSVMKAQGIDLSESELAGIKSRGGIII